MKTSLDYARRAKALIYNMRDPVIIVNALDTLFSECQAAARAEALRMILNEWHDNGTVATILLIKQELGAIANKVTE